MTQTSIAHGSFTIEREYPVPIERVFAAWTTAEAKRGWFAQGDGFLQTTNEYRLDFRIGGEERLDAQLVSGNRLELETVYRDIVPNERIVATYDVLIGGRKISVSVFSVTFEPTETGTRLVTTEQGAFLDDLDSPDDRRRGVERDFEQLGKYLERTAAAVPA